MCYKITMKTSDFYRLCFKSRLKTKKSDVLTLCFIVSTTQHKKCTNDGDVIKLFCFVIKPQTSLCHFVWWTAKHVLHVRDTRESLRNCENHRCPFWCWVVFQCIVQNIGARFSTAVKLLWRTNMVTREMCAVWGRELMCCYWTKPDTWKFFYVQHKHTSNHVNQKITVM